MTVMEPTLGRCLRIWWAWAWRAMLLMMPVMFVMMMLMMLLFPFSQPGGRPPAIDQNKITFTFVVIYPVMLVGVIGSQVVAMRWMLRGQRWRDFFVALIPAKDPVEQMARESTREANQRPDG